ncbi:MAG TPA: Fic family protein [Chitinophagales bacterium]|nr:Fic family protein [Chitinophagales bacterium]
MFPQLQIIPTTCWTAYYSSPICATLGEHFEALHDAPSSNNEFSFYVSVASVYSSKIEGENIDLDSYIKHKRMGVAFLPDYTKKIDDLYNAYIFAQQHPLNAENLALAHRLLSKHLLAKHQRGKMRQQNMYVLTPKGNIEYVAISPFSLPVAMEAFYSDLRCLCEASLSLVEVFYFAAMLHVVFVKIHPWNDGNGRCARLLEKWFLAQHLGEKAWLLPSERYYYQHHANYYHHIRQLGVEYEGLDYEKVLPFLLLLPQAVVRNDDNLSL